VGGWAIGDMHQRHSNALTAKVDHLVVAATSLEEGAAWCERTLGITPGPGGEHPLMGTHNRLLLIATALYPKAYFEIIAINKEAAIDRIHCAKRWFDLENEALQSSLKENGPRLIHFVASTPHAAPAVRALTKLGIDRGQLLEASRPTPNGLLQWKITVRNDGQRLMHGTLPTLIEWGDAHPTDNMAASGVTLQSITASQPSTDQLSAAYASMQLQGVAVVQGQANLIATLQTPRGLVTLESTGI
jgi:Glyoxalase-like domain